MASQEPKPKETSDLNVEIPNTLHKRLRVAASMEDRTIREIVIVALDLHLKNLGYREVPA